jgi:hypothetical protein
MIPFCADQGLGVLPWSPLARGLLTGRIKRPSQAELAALFSKKADVRPFRPFFFLFFFCFRSSSLPSRGSILMNCALLLRCFYYRAPTPPIVS